jgi:hypothetical protein
MSLLSALAAEASIANQKDSGGGNAALESGLYACKVTQPYINKAASGALGLVLNLKTDTGREIRQTLWMSSGTAKGGTNYYTDKNGEKQFLPGFNHANGLCLLTTGKEISAMDTETKVVSVYSPEARAEVPTKVEVVMDLLNQDILVGLIKQTVDKTQKNDMGIYMPTGEHRDENEIDKLFRASDRKTTAEIRAEAPEATFADTWESKWTGKTKDKTKKEAANAASFGGAPKGAAGTKKPATSLFG